MVAVGTQQREDDPVGFDPTVPQLIGKTGIPAVQMVSSVAVPRQAILLAVERKAGEADTVREPAGRLAHAGPVVEIAFEIVVSERHIGHAAFAVGHDDRNDPGADIAQPHLRPRAVGHRIEDHGLAFGRESPNVLLYVHLRIVNSSHTAPRLPGHRGPVFPGPQPVSLRRIVGYDGLQFPAPGASRRGPSGLAATRPPKAKA